MTTRARYRAVFQIWAQQFKGVSWYGDKVLFDPRDFIPPDGGWRIEEENLVVETDEYVMVVRPGDWLVEHESGELGVLPPDLFAKTYEAV